jgi:hypothetical protein
MGPDDPAPQDAQAFIATLDAVDLARFRVVGAYTRYDEAVRNAVQESRPKLAERAGFAEPAASSDSSPLPLTSISGSSSQAFPYGPPTSVLFGRKRLPNVRNEIGVTNVERLPTTSSKNCAAGGTCRITRTPCATSPGCWTNWPSGTRASRSRRYDSSETRAFSLP